MLQSKSGGDAMTLASAVSNCSPQGPAALRPIDTQEKELDGLYRAHARQLRGFARKRVGSQEAEDLVQDVYVRLLQLGEIASLERPREYLYRVATNLAIDSARKVRTRSRFADERMEFSISHLGVTNPEKIVEGLTELRRFQTFLDELAPGTRKVLVLKSIEELTHEEIADRLGVSVRTIERRMSSALKHLRRRVADDLSPKQAPCMCPRKRSVGSRASRTC